jgi:hypothetical protein
MKVQCCRIDGYFQLFEIEFTDGLITDVPRIKEKLATLVLSELMQSLLPYLKRFICAATEDSVSLL